MRRTPSAIVVVSVLALALAACGGSSGSKTPTGSGQSDESNGQQRTVAGEPANFHGTKDVTGMTSVDLEADNYYFEPSVLTGTPGQQLTLNIDNGSSVEHNFTVTTQKVNKDLESGDSATVHVTIPSSGVIAFFCEYHQSKGMAGGLAVTGASLTGSSGSGNGDQGSGGDTGY